MTQHGQGPQGGGGEAPPPGGQPGSGPQSPGQSGETPPAQPSGMAAQGPVQAEGLQPPVANLLAYLFGVISGLIIFLTQRDREVRFHAAQSILLSIALVVLIIAAQVLAFVIAILDPTGVLTVIFGLIAFFAFLAVPVIVIVMCIMGYQEKHIKLPVIGNIAERWAGGAITT